MNKADFLKYIAFCIGAWEDHHDRPFNPTEIQSFLERIILTVENKNKKEERWQHH